jgi:hypothetical protein
LTLVPAPVRVASPLLLKAVPLPEERRTSAFGILPHGLGVLCVGARDALDQRVQVRRACPTAKPTPAIFRQEQNIPRQRMALPILSGECELVHICPFESNAW